MEVEGSWNGRSYEVVSAPHWVPKTRISARDRTKTGGICERRQNDSVDGFMQVGDLSFTKHSVGIHINQDVM